MDRALMVWPVMHLIRTYVIAQATGFPKYREQLPYHTCIIYTALKRNLQALRANGYIVSECKI